MLNDNVHLDATHLL